MNSKRNRQIMEILEDLKGYNPKSRSERYALEENIKFFQAVMNPFSYLKWQFYRAPRIDSKLLLELADFPFNRWRKEMYEQLNAVERRSFPGLLKPLRDKLASMPSRVMLDVGCGDMEVERQVILLLDKQKVVSPRIFIGVDQSPEAYTMVKRNFTDLSGKVIVKKIASRVAETIHQHIQEDSPKHRILFVQMDASKIGKELPTDLIDLVYSSKFKHHLSEEEGKRLDQIIMSKGKMALEFDDYRTDVSWIPIAITAWSKPVLLNGGLLSRLRQPSKYELKKHTESQNVTFHSPPGSYIKVLRS